MISDSWIMLYLIDLSRFPSRKMNSLCWISLYPFVFTQFPSRQMNPFGLKLHQCTLSATMSLRLASAKATRRSGVSASRLPSESCTA